MATLLDVTFSGADQNPLGAPFATASGVAAGLRRIGGQVAASTANTFCCSYDDSNSYPQDHESTVYFGVVGDCGPAVRCTTNGCYFLTQVGGDLKVFKRTGTYFEIGAVLGVTYNAAKRYTLRATGGTPTTLRVYEDGVQVGGALVDDGTTYGACWTTGKAGITGYDGTFRISRFVGADLTVGGTPPSITTQPSSQTVTAPATATFTVAATGSGTLTYQWQLSTNSGTSWADISGATSASYTTAATALADSGNQYRCVVTGSTSPPATSNAAALTVRTVPTVTTQPINQSVVAGVAAAFTVAFAGSPTPTIQWQRSTNSGGSWADISGATSATYTTPATTVTGGSANNGDQYRAVGTNAAGTVTSAAATLTVNASAIAPTVVTNPANQSVAVGATATFTAAFSGTPTPTYQWQMSTDGGGTYNPISGATSANYTTPPTVVGDSNKRFRCVATNSAGNATTTGATLTVNSYSTSAGPCFRNTGDAAPIVSGTLSYTVIYGSIGAYAGNTPIDGTVVPNASTGLITITGLPLPGPADLLLRTADGTAVFYQRVTAA